MHIILLSKNNETTVTLKKWKYSIHTGQLNYLPSIIATQGLQVSQHFISVGSKLLFIPRQKSLRPSGIVSLYIMTLNETWVSPDTKGTTYGPGS